MNKFIWVRQEDTKTAFTRCRHILKTVKNVTVAKFELAFTRYRQMPFQNVPVRVSFSKSTVFKICRQKMYRHLVNASSNSA